MSVRSLRLGEMNLVVRACMCVCLFLASGWDGLSWLCMCVCKEVVRVCVCARVVPRAARGSVPAVGVRVFM